MWGNILLDCTVAVFLFFGLSCSSVRSFLFGIVHICNMTKGLKKPLDGSREIRKFDGHIGHLGTLCVSVYMSYSCSNFWKPCPRYFVLVCGYIFRISRSRSSSQGQGHRSKNEQYTSITNYTYLWVTKWFPSVLWHCWFGHLACKNHPQNDVQCVEWDLWSYCQCALCQTKMTSQLNSLGQKKQKYSYSTVL